MITAITTTKGTMDMKTDILPITTIRVDMKTDILPITTIRVDMKTNTPTIIIMEIQETIKHTKVNIELNKRLQNLF